MKESDIVKAILKYLKTVPGCFAWKEHGGMYGTAVRGKMILPSHGKEFFTSYGKHFFTCLGKQFFT